MWIGGDPDGVWAAYHLPPNDSGFNLGATTFGLQPMVTARPCGESRRTSLAEARVQKRGATGVGGRQGETVRTMIDCLIAAITLRERRPLLAVDRDFEVISKHVGLQLVEAACDRSPPSD